MHRRLSSVGFVATHSSPHARSDQTLFATTSVLAAWCCSRWVTASWRPGARAAFVFSQRLTQRFRELRRLIAETGEARERVEAERRTLRRGRVAERTRGKEMQPPGGATEGEEETGDFEQLARQELLRSRANTLRRQQSEYAEELAQLEVAKEEHIREARRLREEENSKYCERPLLQGRYQIVELLGKGGFSEVWHAVDVSSLAEVAIKIHQLSSAWSDERKSNYIKHAIRENDIQKVGVARGSQTAASARERGAAAGQLRDRQRQLRDGAGVGKRVRYDEDTAMEPIWSGI